jgi:hypothetical protein
VPPLAAELSAFPIEINIHPGAVNAIVPED